MINISIVIPVRNRIYFTQNILCQLQQQITAIKNEKNICVIVVDDGSTDGTTEMVANSFPNFYLIREDGSLWWTGAICLGMQYAIDNFNSNFFVWLNDDLELADNFIQELLNRCKNIHKNDKIIIGGIVTDKTYPEWIVYSGYYQGKPVRNIDVFCLPKRKELEVDVLSGNIVIIPREIVSKVGLPNPKILPHHGGDYEYIKRAIKYGFKAYLSSELQAKTDFQPSDLIRYMPYWMQWHIHRKFISKFKVIKGLTSLKANQNIGVYVNLSKISKIHNEHQLPNFLDYVFCYINKLIKLLIVTLLPPKYIESKIQQYLIEQATPQDIINKIFNKKF